MLCIKVAIKPNKMISYRRETALQGALVLAKSGRLERGDNIFANIIGLSSTTVTQLVSKAIDVGEKRQNKSYYAAQDYSKSSRTVSTENPYATSY